MPFTFTTIRDIRTKVNYHKFIEPLTMFNNMMDGVEANLRVITDRDLKFLRKLIESEIGGDAASTGYPYIDRLFHHYVSNQQDVVFNLYFHGFDVVTFANYEPDYGFKKWRSLWFGNIAADHSVDIRLFLKLFRNLKSFTISRCTNRFIKSVEMKDEFVSSLLDSVSMINADKSLSKSFERLIVVDPDLKGTPFVNLEDVIKEYNGRFVDLGWKMERDTYVHPLDGEECNDSLFITKK